MYICFFYLNEIIRADLNNIFFAIFLLMEIIYFKEFCGQQQCHLQLVIWSKLLVQMPRRPQHRKMLPNL